MERIEKLETLPLRARLGLYILMFMLKIVAPTVWEHEIKDVTEKIMEEIKKT